MSNCMRRVTLVGSLLVIGLGVSGCSQALVPDALDQANAPKGDGWICLFNGKDLTGWERRADHDRPLSWKVVDGTLANVLEEGKHGTDICTKQKFWNQELYYEYMVPQGSNSGMYFRGLYEIQIRGDGGAAGDAGTDGGIWVTAAPKLNASKPAGQWQSVYTKLVDKTVKVVILNGQTIHEDVELTRPTGGNLNLTTDEPGPIMIQGDHGQIQLRNIWIRPLMCCGAAKACGKGPCAAAPKDCPKRGKPGCPLQSGQPKPKACAKTCGG